MKKFSARITCFFFLMTFLFLAFFFQISLSVSGKLFHRHLKTELEQKAILLASQILDFSLNEDNKIQSFVREKSDQIRARITVVTDTGKVLADSQADPSDMNSHITRPEILTAFSGVCGVSVRNSETLNRKMLYLAIPADKSRKIVLRLAVPADLSDFFYSEYKTILRSVFLLLIIPLAAVSFFLGRKFAEPVLQLHESVKKGEISGSSRSLLEDRGEIGEISASINLLQDRLAEEKQIHFVEKQHFSLVSENISEGIFILSSQDQFSFFNKKMKTFFPDIQPDISSMKIFRNSAFSENLKILRTENTVVSFVFMEKDKTFSCMIALTDTDKSVTGVISDISQDRSLDRVKRDLVSSVSHELRTPLTAISGFLETLEQEIPDHLLVYTSPIRRNVKRMHDISKDLLCLSEMEENPSLNPVAIHLRSFFLECVNVFETEACQKGLSIEVNCSDQLLLTADQNLMERIMINLIENAVRYTDRGTVFITAEHTGVFIMISVKDTGIGIPAEHQKRIFERFYVADRSRSKKAGGTGLGLSIVKHAVLLHKGHISLESTPGKGSCFTIQFPVKKS